MATATVHAAMVRYRDEAGRLCEVRIESEDPDEVRRIAAGIRKLNRRSDKAEARWRRRNKTFTDARIRPGDVAENRSAPAGNTGYPWEGPRFDFALLLSESPTWAGPGSLRVRRRGSKGMTCRFCGHFPKVLPHAAYCLSCDRSGKDLLIPKGPPEPGSGSRRGGD